MKEFVKGRRVHAVVRLRELVKASFMALIASARIRVRHGFKDVLRNLCTVKSNCNIMRSIHFLPHIINELLFVFKVCRYVFVAPPFGMAAE
jgi:hypothetical protein